MRFLSPPETMFYSVQLDDSETTERDTIAEAEIVYAKWCEKHPDRKVRLVHIMRAVIYENHPISKVDVLA